MLFQFVIRIENIIKRLKSIHRRDFLFSFGHEIDFVRPTAAINIERRANNLELVHWWRGQWNKKGTWQFGDLSV